MKNSAVHLNADGTLYVIPEHGGWSCLGVDVLIERYNRLAAEIGWRGFPLEERGTLEGYARYQALLAHARESGRRYSADLTPQLVGREGERVEVEARDGSVRRFWVGKSTGWVPIHLEVKAARSLGGLPADRDYLSVRTIRKGPRR